MKDLEQMKGMTLRVSDRSNNGEKIKDKKSFCMGADAVMKIINELPKVDAAPIVHGHWICTMLDDSTDEHGKAIRDYCDHGGDALKWMPDYAYCSKCLKGYCVMDNCMFEEDPNYCPNCGAKMDEEAGE